MIVKKFIRVLGNNQYLVQVHDIDGWERGEEIFATAYKNGNFHHHSFWTKKEEEMFNACINEAMGGNNG